MSCRARDRPWEPRAWGGESPRPAWLHGPRVGSTGGGGSPAGDTLLLECIGRSWFAWLRRLRAPRPACRLRWEPGEPVAEMTWRINRRTWRRRLPRPLPCPARGICLRPRLCPQCKRSEGLGLADLHSCPSRGPSAPPRSHGSGGLTGWPVSSGWRHCRDRRGEPESSSPWSPF